MNKIIFIIFIILLSLSSVSAVNNVSIHEVGFKLNPFNVSISTYTLSNEINFNLTNDNHMALLTSFNVQKINSIGGVNSLVCKMVLDGTTVLAEETLRTVSATGEYGSTGHKLINFTATAGNHQIEWSCKRIGHETLEVSNINIKLTNFESNDDCSKIRFNVGRKDKQFSDNVFTEQGKIELTKTYLGKTFIVVKQTVKNSILGVLDFRIIDNHDSSTSNIWSRYQSGSSDVGSVIGLFIDEHDDEADLDVSLQGRTTGGTATTNATLMHFDLVDNKSNIIRSGLFSNPSTDLTNTITLNSGTHKLITGELELINGTGFGLSAFFNIKSNSGAQTITININATNSTGQQVYNDKKLRYFSGSSDIGNIYFFDSLQNLVTGNKYNVSAYVTVSAGESVIVNDEAGAYYETSSFDITSTPPLSGCDIFENQSTINHNYLIENKICLINHSITINSELTLHNVTWNVSSGTPLQFIFSKSSIIRGHNFSIKPNSDYNNPSCIRPSTVCNGNIGTCDDMFGCYYHILNGCSDFSCAGYTNEQSCVQTGECMWIDNIDEAGQSDIRVYGNWSINGFTARSLGYDNSRFDSNDFAGGFMINSSNFTGKNHFLRDIYTVGDYHDINNKEIFNNLKVNYSNIGLYGSGLVINGFKSYFSNYGYIGYWGGDNISNGEIWNFTKYGIFYDYILPTIINNMTIHNTGLTPVGDCVYLDTVNNFLINNSVLKNCGNTVSSYAEISIIKGGSNTIQNTFFTGTSTAMILDDNNNNIINNCTFVDYLESSWAWANPISIGWGSESDNNTFKNCLFNRSLNGHIWNYGDNNKFYNNTFINGSSDGYGAMLYLDGDNSVVKDNIFIGAKDDYDAIQTMVYGISSNNNIIKNNIFGKFTHKSIDVGTGGASNNNNITNNNFLYKTISLTAGSINYCINKIGNMYDKRLTPMANDCPERNITKVTEGQTIINTPQTFEWQNKFGKINFYELTFYNKETNKISKYNYTTNKTSFFIPNLANGEYTFNITQIINLEGERREYYYSNANRNITINLGGNPPPQNIGGSTTTNEGSKIEENITINVKNLKKEYVINSKNEIIIEITNEEKELIKKQIIITSEKPNNIEINNYYKGSYKIIFKPETTGEQELTIKVYNENTEKFISKKINFLIKKGNIKETIINKIKENYKKIIIAIIIITIILLIIINIRKKNKW